MDMEMHSGENIDKNGWLWLTETTVFLPSRIRTALSVTVVVEATVRRTLIRWHSSVALSEEQCASQTLRLFADK